MKNYTTPWTYSIYRLDLPVNHIFKYFGLDNGSSTSDPVKAVPLESTQYSIYVYIYLSLETGSSTSEPV